MRTRSDREVQQAVQSLFRIRAATQPPDAEGNRTVWHQGEKGVDLFSIVDPGGHIVRQELTLFEDHLLWSRQHGVRTGQLGEEQGSRGYKASPEVRFDSEPSGVRLERASRALDSYTGQDPYILHLQQVIAAALRGQQVKERRAVTNPRIPTLPAVPPPLPDPPRAPHRTRLLAVGALLMGAAAVAIALARLLH
jgi:hypothetical protein